MKKMKLLGLILLIFAAGCSEGAMALKELARNRQAMEAEVNAKRQSFNRLKNDLQNDCINKKTTKQIIVDTFGEPLFCRNLQNKAGTSEVCVFRCPANRMYSDLLYLYFDEKQNFDSWKFESAEIP